MSITGNSTPHEFRTLLTIFNTNSIHDPSFRLLP